jgi:hypothetical protein
VEEVSGDLSVLESGIVAESVVGGGGFFDVLENEAGT